MSHDMSNHTSEVSTLRLYMLRAAYLFIAGGLAVMIWPLLLFASNDVEHMRSVVWALLGAVCLLALLGLRYPLRMLPVLLFELIWKTIWMVTFGLPFLASGTVHAGLRSSVIDTTTGIVLCLIAIPWPYVLAHYVRAPGEPWRSRRAAAGTGASMKPALLIAALLIAVSASPAAAQRMPAEGARVRVHLAEAAGVESTDADVLRGTLVTLTHDSVLLRLHPAAAATAIARSAIERMDVSRGVPSRFESALRNVPGSAVVGVLERLLFRAIGVDALEDEELWESALIGAAGGAVIGAIVGAVAPRERWERVHP